MFALTPLTGKIINHSCSFSSIRVQRVSRLCFFLITFLRLKFMTFLIYFRIMHTNVLFRSSKAVFRDLQSVQITSFITGISSWVIFFQKFLHLWGELDPEAQRGVSLCLGNLGHCRKMYVGRTFSKISIAWVKRPDLLNCLKATKDSYAL